MIVCSKLVSFWESVLIKRMMNLKNNEKRHPGVSVENAFVLVPSVTTAGMCVFYNET